MKNNIHNAKSNSHNYIGVLRYIKGLSKDLFKIMVSKEAVDIKPSILRAEGIEGSPVIIVEIREPTFKIIFQVVLDLQSSITINSGDGRQPSKEDILGEFNNLVAGVIRRQLQKWGIETEHSLPFLSMSSLVTDKNGLAEQSIYDDVWTIATDDYSVECGVQIRVDDDTTLSQFVYDSVVQKEPEVEENDTIDFLE